MLVDQCNCKEYVIDMMIGMMRSGLSCQDMHSSFKLINSKLRCDLGIHSYDSMPTPRRMGSYESLASSELQSAEPNIAGTASVGGSETVSSHRTLQYVGSIYGFRKQSFPTLDSCLLSQEEVYALIFIPLLESSVCEFRESGLMQ